MQTPNSSVPTLLRIDSSARLSGSYSRTLADYFQSQWTRRFPSGAVIVRDLVATPLPHISAETIVGFYGGAVSPGLELSDVLIRELFSADIIILSVPMYNFSLPSSLKAWIDHVVRMGKTFSFDPEQGSFLGLVREKRVVVLTSYGASGLIEGPLVSMDFVRPYLKSLLLFLGVSDVTFIGIEGTTTSPQTLKQMQEASNQKIDELIQNFA